MNWQGPGQKVARNKLAAAVPLYGYDFAYKKDKDPESGQTPPGYKVLRYKELVQQFPGASTAANANIKVSGKHTAARLRFGIRFLPVCSQHLSGNAANGDQVQSLADAIKNKQDLGNARTSAFSVLQFVSTAEGNIDATKFIKDNKVDDGADHDDAKVFHDAAYAFSQLNGGVPNGASEQNVLDRFRTALNWDFGNHTSAPNVASEWDSFLFAENPKGQGYHSVGLQLNFEQAGEQATKNLDNGVERTATQYHYVVRFQPKAHVPNPQIHEGDGDNTAELWLEEPGDKPPDTVSESGVNYTLEKGSDGKPVSRQEKVRDAGALNQAIAKVFGSALQNYKPQYDKSGNLQNADPINL